MQKTIKSHIELAEIKEMGKGYVLNIRPDGRKLHAANCNYLDTMYTKEYEKVFFDDLEEARKWCREKFGNRWKHCGFCL
jgi:hypothetical protein